jgi:signal transduction histidine kinase
VGDLAHSLLLRQLKRVFGDAPVPPELAPILHAIDEAYREFDADRALLERSLDLSSQELMQANADMNALFRAFPDQFYRLDARGVVVDHRAGSESGDTPSRLLGRAFRDLLPEDSVPDYDMTRARVRLQRRTASFEYVVPGPAGEAAYEARVVPLLDDQTVVIVRTITERRRAEASAAALARVSGEIAATLDVDRAMQLIVDNLHTLFRVRRAAVFRLDTATGLLVCRAAAGRDQRTAWVGATLPLGHGVAGVAAKERRVVWSANITADPDLPLPDWAKAHAYAEGYRSVLGFPLIARDTVIGSLAVGDDAGRFYTEEEKRLLLGFADQAAIAIDNARLFEDTHARLAQMRRLAELSQLVTSSLDQRRVLDFVADAALDLLRGDLARLWLVEGDDDRLRLAASRARGELPAEGGVEILPAGAGLAGWVVQQRRSRSAPDLLSDPLVFQKDWFVKAGIVSQLVVPLVAGDEAIGALVVSTRVRRVFDQEDIELMEIFAAKAAIALSNARLYREAQEAYDQLARAQDLLMQAQKMDAVGRLAGGIAHDFNNLLTVIIGRLDAALDVLPRDDARRADIELAAGAAERASGLTRQLLAFSRRQALAPAVTDLNVIVRDVAQLLRRLIGENIELGTTLASAPTPVRADRGQIEQVIVNLVVNARDAMPAGGRLTIGTASVDIATPPPTGVDAPPGAYVRLTVTDSGHGMDPETRRRVFDPFFTTKDIGRGTGLGLATVYGIVKQHEGYVAVDSAPGAGATFRIYLPRVEGDVVTATPASVPRAEGWETILLVEDEAEVRAVARQALENAGYRVIEASVPTDALRIAAEWPQPIHLLVTDAMMPEMTGRAVADAVRQVRPGVKTLFISGYTEEVADAPGDFLGKPFTGRALAGKVREVLDRT